jgi:hypothetical protein
MRTKSEIEDRIRFLLVRELERRVQKAIERLPHRCVYNHRQPLDTRKTVEDETNPYYNRITMGIDLDGNPVPVHQTIGLCTYKEESTGYDAQARLIICEDPVDAQSCPLFFPRKSKSELWAEYREQISNLAWLQENLPEVYGLYWALESEAEMRAPWWARLLYYFLRIRPEPLRMPTELVKLLPPPT